MSQFSPPRVAELHSTLSSQNGLDLVREDPLKPADHLGNASETLFSHLPHLLAAMLRSHYAPTKADSYSWYPVRPLSLDLFGASVLWQKRDSQGNVVEETTVRQQAWVPHMALEKQNWIAREFAVTTQLNSRQSENIVYMKDFKIFTELQNKKITWRFYHEHCPYGNLETLAGRYKAWGSYLPEEFLWRVFHSMARVAKMIGDGSFSPLEPDSMTSGPQVLIHTALQPANSEFVPSCWADPPCYGTEEEQYSEAYVPLVLLGYSEDGDTACHQYPVIKVGNWGHADVTNNLDRKNPEKFDMYGSMTIIPPESRGPNYAERLRGWARPPFDRTKTLQTGYAADYAAGKVGPAHTIWGIGAVLCVLMTHKSPYYYSSSVDDITEEQYMDRGEEIFENISISTKRRPQYQPDLQVLIKRCLNLDPSYRPTFDEILQITSEKVQNINAQSAAGGITTQESPREGITRPYSVPRLYFKGNEINEMPLGQHLRDFKTTKDRVADFIVSEECWSPPPEQRIEHPARGAVEYEYCLLKLEAEWRQQAAKLGVNAGLPVGHSVRERGRRPSHEEAQSDGGGSAVSLCTQFSPSSAASTPVQENGSEVQGDQPANEETSGVNRNTTVEIDGAEGTEGQRPDEAMEEAEEGELLVGEEVDDEMADEER